jgi:hypothetical protein
MSYRLTAPTVRRLPLPWAERERADERGAADGRHKNKKPPHSPPALTAESELEGAEAQ